jgi:hypothetical protein
MSKRNKSNIKEEREGKTMSSRRNMNNIDEKKKEEHHQKQD